MIDHKLVVDQLKSQCDLSQLELKDQREKSSHLTRQLNDERFDKQYDLNSIPLNEKLNLL